MAELAASRVSAAGGGFSELAEGVTQGVFRANAKKNDYAAGGLA